MRSGEHLAGTFIVGADRDHQVAGAERRLAARGQSDVQTRVAVERSGDADEQPRPGPRAELAAPALALAAEPRGEADHRAAQEELPVHLDRQSTRLNSSH